MIEVTDEMLKVARSMQSFELMIKRIIELHEANKPKHEPVGLGEEWMPCIKLPVIVHVRKQRQDEQHVSTREGLTPVRPDDLIMRGVSGEEYPIGSEIFNKTYTLDTTTLTREPLSDDRINYLIDMMETSCGERLVDFARAVEQAHGIGVTND